VVGAVTAEAGRGIATLRVTRKKGVAPLTSKDRFTTLTTLGDKEMVHTLTILGDEEMVKTLTIQGVRETDSVEDPGIAPRIMFHSRWT
jgi:hypothetical protein